MKFEETGALSARPPSTDFQIEITSIPPSEQGGPKTSNHIAGTVSGKIESDYLVAIYVRAYGAWYVQPIPRAVHPIHPGNTWGSWTHTGTRYAALLVKGDFEPLGRFDMLPEVKGSVLACAIVDGVRPPPRNTNAAPNLVPTSR